MNKMIRLTAAVLILAVALMGCKSAPNAGNDGISIVTTVYAAYDIARQVAGPHADISLLLKPGSESHTFEPTPADMVRIGSADILICSGGENDTWVDTLLSSIDSSRLTVIRMLDLVDALEEELAEGMQAEEEEDEEGDGPEWDEHVWMSPANAALIAAGISASLTGIDPDNSSDYDVLLSSYKDKLAALDSDLHTLIDNAPRREVIFADRFPARYFVEEYGLKYYAAFPGCSENTEASPATVSFLIDKVREDSIPAVFKIELSSGRLADTVSAESGAQVLTFFTGHNVTADDMAAGMTYIDMMYRNLEALKTALY